LEIISPWGYNFWTGELAYDNMALYFVFQRRIDFYD